MEERRREDWQFNTLRDDIKEVKTDLKDVKIELQSGISNVAQKLDSLAETTHKNSSRITRLEVITGLITSAAAAVAGWFGFNSK